MLNCYDSCQQNTRQAHAQYICGYANPNLLLQISVIMPDVLRYEPVPYDKHDPPKTRGLSMETAMTITMWASIVAFLTMVATLSLVTYNAFQLSKPDDVTCTLDEYSQLQWVTVPTSLAKQLPETLLYKESADSPVTKGTAVIPETQKTTCAEKLHHASPENTELSQRRRQLSVGECTTVTPSTTNFDNTPIFKQTEVSDSSQPSFSHITVDTNSAKELSYPADKSSCTILNLPSTVHMTSFVYYLTESGNGEVASGDGASIVGTSILDFPNATTYLGFFDGDTTLLYYMRFPVNTEAQHIWNIKQTISDKTVDVHLYNVDNDFFIPTRTMSTYPTRSNLVAVDLSITSGNNGLSSSFIHKNPLQPVLNTFDFDQYAQVVLSSQ
jgi:hypothetical protein